MSRSDCQSLPADISRTRWAGSTRTKVKASRVSAGAGSQTSGQRWGDYSSMNIDPVDDCTFWYTTQYYPANGTNWRLRIGSFKYPPANCTPLPVELQQLSIE